MVTGLNGLEIYNNVAHLKLTAIDRLDGLSSVCDSVERWMDMVNYPVNIIVDMSETSLSVSTLTRLQQLYSYAHPNLGTLIFVHARPLVKFAFNSIHIPNHTAPTLLFMDTLEEAQAYLADDDATIPSAALYPFM